jgi:DNA-binding Lrp family transcriptional regulator
MAIPSRITDSEKRLLHAVGSNPNASTKQLLEYTGYKWERTMRRKLMQLKEQHILSGPYYYINYRRLCKSPLYKVLCIVESNQDYDTVISYLKVIESLLWIYPVLSPHKRVLNVFYYSTDNKAMVDILQLLKEKGIITDYIFRILHYRGPIENPNLFGDFDPPLDNLLDLCDIPDMSSQHHDTHWNECDIAVLPYLERGTQLIEILRKENHNSKTWTYEQIKYSREKMIKNGLIEKLYMFNPFPLDQCLRFRLLLRTEDVALTHRIVHNFARGERVSKQCGLYVGWGDINIWGSVNCTAHPSFLKDLMHKLDAVEEIVEREVYQIRSFPHKKYYFSQPSRFDYYDVETQTLEYPYHVYEEKIKEKLEHEPVIISV